MAKTLLNGVNEVLKRAQLIQGDSGALTTLSDSPRQVWIDTVVQAWNEAVEELYSTCGQPIPQQLAEATVTLVTNTRAYSLNAFSVLYWPLHDTTNGQFIYEWEGDYLSLANTQLIPADYTGLPLYGVIRPTDDKLYLDRIPTATENGLVYTYRYKKDVAVSAAADTFPFKDSVFRALVPAVAELFNLNSKREFSGDLYRVSMGRAARELTGRRPRDHYGPDRVPVHTGIFAPFDG